MLLNTNRFVYKRLFQCLKNPVALYPKHNSNKESPSFIAIRNYSDESSKDPFEPLAGLRTDFESNDDLFGLRTDTFFKEPKKDKPDQIFSKTNPKDKIFELDTNSKSYKDKRKSISKTFNSAGDSIRRNESELLRQVKQVFELVNCDLNALEANSVLSVIKHSNLILSEHKWERKDIEEFLLSDQYGFILSGIILFHKKMDPFSLKEVVKFLELLGLSRTRDSSLRQVYATITERMHDPSLIHDRGNEISGSKKIKIIDNATTLTGKEENIRRKVANAASGSLSNDEMFQILKEGATIEFKKITPTFLVNYFEILNKVSTRGRKVNFWKYGIDDLTKHLLKNKKEFREQLPQLFLLSAKIVADGKIGASETVARRFLSEAKKCNLSVDQHFVVLKSLNIWKIFNKNYLHNCIIKNVVEDPDILERVENFEIFLDALRLADFKQDAEWPFVESFIKDLNLLKNEDQLKNLNSDRLSSITDNLAFLNICPSFLLQPVISSAVCNEEQHNQQPHYEELPTKDTTEKENDPNVVINMFQNLEDSQMDSLVDEQLIKILSEASLTSLENITPTFLLNYYKLLNKLKKDSAGEKEVGLNNKLYKCIAGKLLQDEEFVKQIPSFLPVYATAICTDKEKFRRKLVDEMIEELMKNETITIQEHFSVLDSLNKLKIFNMTHLQQIVTYVLEDSKIVEESAENLNIFLEALTLSDFQSQNKNQWPFIKSSIRDLSILNNENLWKDVKSLPLVHIVKNLALFGIYSDPLLSFVANAVNSDNLESSSAYCSELLVLNQSIATLHPSFKQTLLTGRNFTNIERIYEERRYKSVKLKRFVSDVKANLESEKRDDHVVLTNCYTKLGLKIDLALALNELNKPFSFQKFLGRPKKFFIDDIATSLPENYQLMFLCLFEEDDCLRDGSQLTPMSQLKLKTFEAMGYIPVPILNSEWLNVERSERGSYIWKKVIEFNSCNIPEDMLEKAREPLFID